MPGLVLGLALLNRPLSCKIPKIGFCTELKQSKMHENYGVTLWPPRAENL